jgi:hypothetical protein
LLNTYHYTVYVPTNASIQALQDAGKLPTWEQVEAEAETSVKDSLNKVISDFLKYHIQDNAVFIGSGNQTGEYETACINPVTQRFYKLNVTADNNGITIKDLANKTRQVTGNPPLRNLMAREYQYNNKDVALANEIETSSYVVIHQIDEPLSYDPAHFALRPSQHQKTSKAMKNYLLYGLLLIATPDPHPAERTKSRRHHQRNDYRQVRSYDTSERQGGGCLQSYRGPLRHRHQRELFVQVGQSGQQNPGILRWICQSNTPHQRHRRQHPHAGIHPAKGSRGQFQQKDGNRRSGHSCP